MHMDTAAVVCYGACRSQLAYNLLNGFNITVFTDGADEFHAVSVISTSAFCFLMDAGIAYNFPLAAFTVGHRISIIRSAVMIKRHTEML